MVRNVVDLVFAPTGLAVTLEPIVDVRADVPRLVGAEGALRLPAAVALRVADMIFDYVRRGGNESPIDRACLATVLRAAGLLDCLLDISLNVNASTIERDEGFVQAVLEAAAENGVSNDRLVIEVIEAEGRWRSSAFERAMRAFRAAGARDAFDAPDLERMEASSEVACRTAFVKVGRAQVGRSDRNEEARAQLDRYVALARRAGALVVATGVATSEELGALRAAGVTHAQGLLFGAPSTIDEFIQLPLYLAALGRDEPALARA